MAPWEEALWFVCTLLNIACLMLAWVYAFDIIGQESEALEAQEAANKPRPAGAGADSDADSGDGDGEGSTAAAAASSSGRGGGGRGAAGGRGREGREAAGAVPHAAAPSELDEAMGIMEGSVAYKQLLGAGMNASHIAGADVEAQEFETVADRVNFDVSEGLRRRRVWVGFVVGRGGVWEGRAPSRLPRRLLTLIDQSLIIQPNQITSTTTRSRRSSTSAFLSGWAPT
jgi:hypothetical protein